MEHNTLPACCTPNEPTSIGSDDGQACRSPQPCGLTLTGLPFLIQALVGLEASHLSQGPSTSNPEVAKDSEMMSTDRIVADLRVRVANGLRKKLDDDLASMMNCVADGDSEAVKLLLDKGFNPNTQVRPHQAPSAAAGVRVTVEPSVGR
jgi:hypothetical protein